MEIIIENVSYTSIGEYHGANIYDHVPTDRRGWILFFIQENPIILLWTMSALNNDGELGGEIEDVFDELGNQILQNPLIIDFLKKYCWEDILSDDFVDFAYGIYTSYPSEPWPMILHNNVPCDEEDFQFKNYIFIKTSEYAEFMDALDKAVEFTIEALAKDFDLNSLRFDFNLN